MLNVNRYVLGAIVGLIIVLLLIHYSNNAVIVRLDRIADSLGKEVARNERAREQKTLDERIGKLEKAFAESSTEISADLKAEAAERELLAAKLADASANKPELIFLELRLNMPPSDEPRPRVKVAVTNPPIESAIGRVANIDGFAHVVPNAVGPDGFQYLVTQYVVENEEVKLDYSATTVGENAVTESKTLSFKFTDLFVNNTKGTQVDLGDDIVLSVICYRGAQRIETR